MKIVPVFVVTKESNATGQETFVGVFGTREMAEEEKEQTRIWTYRIEETWVEVPDDSIEDSPEPTH